MKANNDKGQYKFSTTFGEVINLMDSHLRTNVPEYSPLLYQLRDLVHPVPVEEAEAVSVLVETQSHVPSVTVVAVQPPPRTTSTFVAEDIVEDFAVIEVDYAALAEEAEGENQFAEAIRLYEIVGNAEKVTEMRIKAGRHYFQNPETRTEGSWPRRSEVADYSKVIEFLTPVYEGLNGDFSEIKHGEWTFDLIRALNHDGLNFEAVTYAAAIGDYFINKLKEPHNSGFSHEQRSVHIRSKARALGNAFNFYKLATEEIAPEEDKLHYKQGILLSYYRVVNKEADPSVQDIF